jgi:hypothetical protein
MNFKKLFPVLTCRKSQRTLILSDTEKLILNGEELQVSETGMNDYRIKQKQRI